MKKLHTLFAALVGAALLGGSLVGCSDITQADSSAVEGQTTAYGRVAFTSSAVEALSNITFKGTNASGKTTTFFSNKSAEEVSDETVQIPVGSYTFYLSATYDDVEVSGSTTGEIKENETTSLSFTLSAKGVQIPEDSGAGEAFSVNWYFADYVSDYTYTENKYSLDNGKTATAGSVTVTGKATLSDSASTTDNSEKKSGYVQLGAGGSSSAKNMKISLPAGTTKVIIWAKCGTSDSETNASKTSAVLATSGAVSSSNEYAKGSAWSATEITVSSLASAADLVIYNGGDKDTGGSLNISAILYSGVTISENGGGNSSGGSGNSGGVSGNQNGEGSTTVSEAGTPGTVETTGSVVFTTQGSWNEALYATWENVSGADGYKVSYSTDNSTWTDVDAELVRAGWTVREIQDYGLSYTDKSYTLNRVDIVGIKPNTKYYVKVQPTKSGSATLTASTFSATTGSYYRGGYAFFNRTTTGAYNADGTLADKAQVIYVTDENKNSVKATIDGTEYTGLVDIMAGMLIGGKEKSHRASPVSIRFLGTVTFPESQKTAIVNNKDKSGDVLNSGLTYLLTKYSDNLTFEGVGPGAMLYGWGLTVKVGNNIEIRNLACNMQKEDALSFEDTVIGGWIHNNDLYIGANGGGDKKKGDGGSDIKADCNYFTFSYNHYVSTGKSSLCGMSGDSAPEKCYITYCNNWFDKCGSRTPRIRRYNVHIYNNYFDHNYSAGVAVTRGASAFVQNNYFEDVNQPVISASQGHSVKTDGTDFCSGEPGGVVKMYGNIMAECGNASHEYLDGDLNVVTNHYKCTDRFTGAREITDAMKVQNSKGFYPSAPDAFIANSRDEQVPSTFIALSGGESYRNFDTDSSLCYSDTAAGMLAASVVKENCMTKAGRFASN